MDAKSKIPASDRLLLQQRIENLKGYPFYEITRDQIRSFLLKEGVLEYGKDGIVKLKVVEPATQYVQRKLQEMREDRQQAVDVCMTQLMSDAQLPPSLWFKNIDELQSYLQSVQGVNLSKKNKMWSEMLKKKRKRTSVDE